MSIFLVTVLHLSNNSKILRKSVKCYSDIRDSNEYLYSRIFEEINAKKRVRQIRANKISDVHVESIERCRHNSSIKMHACGRDIN